MRNFLVYAVTIAFFAALCFAGILQDRMRRKAGGSPMSLGFLRRTLATRELYLFILIIGLLWVAGTVLVALDSSGYFQK